MFLDNLLKLYNAYQAKINHIALIIIIGFLLILILNNSIRLWMKKKVTPQTQLILYKIINYGGFIIIVLAIMSELGIRLSVLFGAAGIAAIAISFAAQNSLSNIIGGIFLLWEKPFKIGDLIKIEDKMGIIYSMDLLSVNLRTFDNLLIRIPNEIIMKATLINVSRFPIRRLDLKIDVAYKDDVDHVFEVLKDIAKRNPYCLDEPEPVIIFQGFMDSSQQILFGLWFDKADYLVLRNSILKEIKKRFDAEGIEIPFPHRTVYAGTVTEPFPMKMIKDTPKGEVNDDKPDAN